jgi:hypothetical protein
MPIPIALPVVATCTRISDPCYHLLVVDDDGGLILVEQVIDFEAAAWLTTLVNAELARLRGAQP